jgi:hypothetical protein
VYFELMMGGIHEPPPADSNIAPLKPTAYSVAVKAFNDERARIKRWSEQALMDLRKICEQHKDALDRGGSRPGGPDLIDRINRLLPVVRRYPNLFVASQP